jgi:hypothetical protein
VFLQLQSLCETFGAYSERWNGICNHERYLDEHLLDVVNANTYWPREWVVGAYEILVTQSR